MQKSNEPLVSVLLAVYKPNYTWLGELLASIKAQTYSNIEFIVYDDCPTDMVDESIFVQSGLSYKLVRGRENLGSNKAFEALAVLSTGEYIAFCDQDDIWHEYKIEVMVREILETNAVLVCSDMSIIDKAGKTIATSISSIRPRHQFRSGEGLTQSLLVKNFVVGCASLMRADLVKKAVPFSAYYVHDHYLAIMLSMSGRIEFLKTSLVQYRQHSSNQTSVLAGVRDKSSYRELRLVKLFDGICDILSRVTDKQLLIELEKIKAWQESRLSYFSKPNKRDLAVIKELAELASSDIKFESMCARMPNFMFKLCLKIIKKR